MPNFGKVLLLLVFTSFLGKACGFSETIVFSAVLTSVCGEEITFWILESPFISSVLKPIVSVLSSFDYSAIAAAIAAGIFP